MSNALISLGKKEMELNIWHPFPADCNNLKVYIEYRRKFGSEKIGVWRP